MHKKPAEMYFPCNKRLLLPLDQFALWRRAGAAPSPGDVSSSPQAFVLLCVFAGWTQQGRRGAFLDARVLVCISDLLKLHTHTHSTSGHNKLKKDLSSKRLQRDSAVPATNCAFSILTFKCSAKFQACDKSTL